MARTLSRRALASFSSFSFFLLVLFSFVVEKTRHSSRRQRYWERPWLQTIHLANRLPANNLLAIRLSVSFPVTANCRWLCRRRCRSRLLCPVCLSLLPSLSLVFSAIFNSSFWPLPVWFQFLHAKSFPSWIKEAVPGLSLHSFSGTVFWAALFAAIPILLQIHFGWLFTPKLGLQFGLFALELMLLMPLFFFFSFIFCHCTALRNRKWSAERSDEQFAQFFADSRSFCMP